jgi:hypothetical protein
MIGRGFGIPPPSFCESQEFDLTDVVKCSGDFFLKECFSFSPYNPTFQSIIDDFEFLPFMS